MELKSRSAYILKCAIESEKGVSVKEILERLSITKRTFYYDIEKIEEWLQDNKFGTIEIQSQMIRVVSNKMEELRKNMEQNTDYFYSIDERRTMEVLFIALSPGAVTIEKMQKLFEVSKNTVLTDIRKCKEMLAEKEMSLISTIREGYYITGEEFSIRKLISSQLQLLKNPQPIALIKRQLQESLEELSGKEYDYKEIARCLIFQYVRDVDIRLGTENIEYECMMIMVSWIRSMKGYVFTINEDEKETLRNTGSFRSLKNSVESLRKYGIEISENETFYITTLLLGIKTTEFASQEAENLFVYRFTAMLIRNYERVACTTLFNREKLSNQLKCHIRPLYYRLKYGLQETNPLSGDVKEKYPEVYEFTKRALKEITNELSVMITEEELEYLVIYFVSHEHSEREEEDPFSDRPWVLVVCGEGMATSILVREQLEEMIGGMYQYRVKSAAEIRKEELDRYEMIVSTVYIEALKEKKNVFFTSAILTQKDQFEIVKYIAEHDAVFKHKIIIQDILQAVDKNTSGKVEWEHLYFELFQIFQGKQYSNRVKGRFIEQMLNLDVFPVKEYLDWTIAVREGCHRLMEGKNAEHLYQRMLGILDNKTMNIYAVRQGVLLIHCPMQGIENREINCGMVVSKRPVRFLNGMQGTVLIFFSTIDQSSHFKILKNLYEYIDSTAGYRKLAELEAKGNE